MCDNSHSGVCQHKSSNPSVEQTLDELDFTRGIWTAALNGSCDDVKNCLNKKQTSVDSADSSGYTALHYASRSGHLDVCRLLLDHNANPNVQTRSGAVTPLHRAAYCGHSKIVQLLLQHGADPVLADVDGKLPIHKAAEKGHSEIVKLLVKTEPSCVFYKDNRGLTPADCVPGNTESDIKLILQEHSSVNKE